MSQYSHSRRFTFIEVGDEPTHPQSVCVCVYIRLEGCFSIRKSNENRVNPFLKMVYTQSHWIVTFL